MSDRNNGNRRRVRKMSHIGSQADDVPLGDTAAISVERLALDRDNPRFADLGTYKTEESVIAQLYAQSNLNELLMSISTVGYVDVEPLVVFAGDAEGGRLTILDGNRRVAAIRLLLKPELAKSISRETGIDIKVPNISDKHRKTLTRVSVYRVESREAARELIGLRHMNGQERWGSYAMAKFAAAWHRAGNGAALENISSAIGDRSHMIRRMVMAIFVLEQAERNEIYSLSDRTNPLFNFTLIYAALSQYSYVKHLGIENKWKELEKVQDIVPEEKYQELEDLLIWIYGSKKAGRNPIVEYYSDIKDLGEVIESPEGILELRSGKSLKDALKAIRPPDRTLAESLINARTSLREAMGSLHGYHGNDTALQGIAESVFSSARIISEQIAGMSSDVARDDHVS